MGENKFNTLKKIAIIIILLYIFLLSINLMGASFKMFGKGFAEQLIKTTSNPFVGLLVGILATSIIQSSSTTTAIVVGCVAGDILTLSGAIPIIMGANIGTTVTNTIVSLGHIGRKDEFKRALAAGTVHDFFNILAVLILFPLELTTHILEKSASILANKFVGFGGIKFLSPLKLITTPGVNLFKSLTHNPIILVIISLVFLFFALIQIVKVMRSLVLKKIEVFLDSYLFKNDFTAFFLGILFTAIVQSSSVTTSLMVPLVGAGLLTVRKIFPYTLGGNIGTTITAILASFVTLNPVAVTVAFAHLLFNIFGIAIIYPFKKIPIWLAENFASFASRSKKHTILCIAAYFSLYIIPLIFILLIK